MNSTLGSVVPLAMFVDQVAEVNLIAVELVLPSFDMEEYKYYYFYLLYDRYNSCKKVKPSGEPSRESKSWSSERLTENCC